MQGEFDPSRRQRTKGQRAPVRILAYLGGFTMLVSGAASEPRIRPPRESRHGFESIPASISTPSAVSAGDDRPRELSHV